MGSNKPRRRRNNTCDTTGSEKEIKENINKKKASVFDLRIITGEMVKQLPRRATVQLANVISAAFRSKYVPRLWKVAEVIMIPKPGKPPHEVTSYWPV
jgi:hypothetical protein